MLFPEIRTEADLLPPGATPGTIPTDLEQATGLERFEILGKMQGIDVFDMKPLDASRVGMLSPRPPYSLQIKREPMTTNPIYMHGFLNLSGDMLPPKSK